MRFLSTLLATAAIATAASAAVKTEVVEYEFEGTKMKGMLAYDDAKTGKRPGIMVVHEWWGLNDYAKKRAEHSPRWDTSRSRRICTAMPN